MSTQTPTAKQINDIQHLYVAYFNRPADSDGLLFWGNILAASSTPDVVLAQIASSFSTSAEYNALFAGENNSQILNTIYENLFGRAVDVSGKAFWLPKLDSGSFTLSNAVTVIAQGAQGHDQVVLDNKLAAAVAFTASLVTPAEKSAYSGAAVNSQVGVWLSQQADVAWTAPTPSQLNDLNVLASQFTSIPNGGTFTLTDGVTSTKTVAAYSLVDIAPGSTGAEQISVPGVKSTTSNAPAVLTWSTTVGDKVSSGIPVSELDSFLQNLIGLNLDQVLAKMAATTSSASNAGTPTSITIGNISGTATSDNGGSTATSTITMNFANNVALSVPITLASDYMTFLNLMLFNEDGSSRLSMQSPDNAKVTGFPINHIVLTPTNNTGGTIETGFTTAGNDTIVVGRPELLMGAYIDGGAGYNTLQIEMKGVFAQPAELLNIQEVDVENMPHLYTNADGTSSYPAITNNGTGGCSYLDLSMATSVQKVVITEGLPFHGINIGPLNIVGIQGSTLVNGTTVETHIVLEGGFTQPVNLSYGLGQTGTVNLDLQLGNTQHDFALNLGNAAGVLNINSMGYANTIAHLCVGQSGVFDGTLSKIVVSGTGILEIDNSLTYDFSQGSIKKPNIIDATTNTGGVILNADDNGYTKFLGSQAADSFSAQNNTSVIIVAQANNNADNEFNTDGTEHVAITAMGNGIETISSLNNISAIINVGNGNNSITADTSSDAGIKNQSIVINVGNGVNTISANNTNQDGPGIINGQSVTIKTGTGSETISALHNDSVTINAGNSTGNNVIEVSANHIAITTGTGNDVITVFGETPACHFFSNGTNNKSALESTLTTPGCLSSLQNAAGAVLNIHSGSGHDTVVLGDSSGTNILGDNAKDGFVALTGSVINGTNITLQVNESSDISQASLTGVSSVVLNNTSANRLSNLTLSEAQFELIGAANISVNNAAFGAIANINIIITANTDFSALNLSALSPNVRLNFNILNGSVLTMTAAELSQYVAVGGVVSTDGLNGSIIINNAGTNFDPFATGNSYKVIAGGSLNQDFNLSTNVTINRVVDNAGGYERPAPNNSIDTLTIDSTNIAVADFIVSKSIDASNNNHEMTLNIMGNQNVVFNAGVTVSLPASSTIDFHNLAGTVTGLTLSNVQNVVHVVGNDIPTTVDLQMTGNVTEFNTSGVSEYLVTLMTGNYIIDLTNEKDVHVLGLQGNNGHTLTISNVPWGASAPTFLLQGDGVANASQAAVSNGANPNISTVGGIDILFNDVQGPGAPAVVNINNAGVALGTTVFGGVRALVVEGITVHNAGSLTINVTDGNALIGHIVDISDSNSLATLDLTASGSLSVDGELPSGLTTIDASAVTGLFAATIGNNESALSFIGGAGGVNLTLNHYDALAGTTIDLGAGATQLTIENATDLNLAALTHVSAVVLNNASTLTLNFDQFNAITAAHITVDTGTATLNLHGLDGQPFSVADLAPGLTIQHVTIADIPVVTLDATTDLTGIGALVVDKGTVLNLTAHQYMELTNRAITGFGTVNITGLTQADIDAGLDLDGIATDNIGSITLDPAATHVNLQNVAKAPTDLGTFTHFVLSANQTLGVATQTQADGLIVDNGAGGIASGSVLEMLFEQLTHPADHIDASHFNVATLQVLSSLYNIPLDAEKAFSGLSNSTVLEIINTLVDVTSINRQVIVDAGVTLAADVVFRSFLTNTEINNLTLTLAGGVDLTNDLILSHDQNTGSTTPLIFQVLNIVSAGTAHNHDSGLVANIIEGQLTPFPVAPFKPNNLLTVNVDATQDLIIKGGIVFNSVETSSQYSLAATAHVVVTGTANVDLGVLDTSTVHHVTTLNVANTGTGNLSVTLDGNKMYSNNGVSEVVNFSGSNIDLIIGNNVDLTADDLTGVTHLTLVNNSHLTLNFDQFNAITAAHITVDTGTATLNLHGLDGQPFSALDLAPGVNIGEFTLADIPVVTLDPTTDLTGIISLVVNKGTVLNLTAHQFMELGAGLTPGSITGHGTVNITGLTQAEIDAGINLLGITTDHVGTISLDPAATHVNLQNVAKVATLFGAFTHFVLSANQTLGVANQNQADGLIVDNGAGGIAPGSVLEMLFGNLNSQFDHIDASHFNVTSLQVLNTLFNNPLNAESAFKGLPSETQLEIISRLLNVTSINRQVLVDAGVSVVAATVFNSIQTNTEINSLTLTLAGGVDLNGNLRLSYTDTTNHSLTPLLSQVLNIVSEGTALNNNSGIADNIIHGSITPFTINAQSNDNNLLTVNIAATQNLVIDGGIQFNSVHTGIASSDHATANVVVTGTANVDLGVLDTSTVQHVSTLNVANTGTGILSVTLDGNKMYSVDGVSEVVNFSGDHIDLIIQNEVNLTADDLTGVTKLTLNSDDVVLGDVSLVLTADQLNTIGNANIFTTGTNYAGDHRLNIVDLGSVAFDATTLPDTVQVDYVEIKAGNITLDPTTNLTGVREIIVHEGSTLNMTALQFIQLENDGGHIVGIATDGVASFGGSVNHNTTNYVVNITDFGNATLTAEQLVAEQNIHLGSEVVTATGLVNGNGLAGTISLAAGANFAFSKSAFLGGSLNSINTGTLELPILVADGFKGGFGIDLGANDHLTLGTVAQASGRTITGTDSSVLSLALSYQTDQLGIGITGIATSAPAVGHVPINGESTVLIGGQAYVGLETAAYTGGFTLQVLHTLVEGTNVEQVLAHLSSGITVNVVTAAEIPTAPADLTNRVVIVDPNTTIATNAAGDSLVFANLTSTGLMKNLSLDLTGGDNVLGNIDISTLIPLNSGYTPSYFDTLTIKSEGNNVNYLAVDNSLPLSPAYSVIEASLGNNLLKVDINATEALYTGIIDFTSITKNATATVTVNGSADVSIAELSTSNVNKNAPGTVSTIDIVDNLTDGKVLTIPGNTPAINDVASTLTTLELSGTGNMVIGSLPTISGTLAQLPSLLNSQPAIESSVITLIDASALSGELTVYDIAQTNSKDFTFTSGTGLTLVTLGDHVSVPQAGSSIPLLELAAGTADKGWVYDLSNAAANSSLIIDTNVTTFTSGHFEVDLGTNGNTVVLNGWKYGDNINNLLANKFSGLSAFDIKGTNGTLDINGDVDFSSLDTVTNKVETNNLDLSGVKSIVLSVGSSVEMTDAEYKAFTDAGGTITGPGTTLEVTSNATTLDLTQYRGVTAIHLDQGIIASDLYLTAQQALVTTLYTDSATPATYPVGVPPVDTAYTAGDFTGLNVGGISNDPRVHILVTSADSSDISALKLYDTCDIDVQAGVIIPTLTINEAEAFALQGGTNNAGEDLTNVSTLVINTYADLVDINQNVTTLLPITVDIAHYVDGSFKSASVTANSYAMSTFNADIIKAGLVQGDVAQYLTEVTQTGLGGKTAAMSDVINTVDVIDHYQFLGLSGKEITALSAMTIDSLDTKAGDIQNGGRISLVNDTFDFTAYLGTSTTDLVSGIWSGIGTENATDISGKVLLLDSNNGITGSGTYLNKGQVKSEISGLDFAMVNNSNAVIYETNGGSGNNDIHIWAAHDDVNGVISVALIGTVLDGAHQSVSAANFV